MPRILWLLAIVVALVASPCAAQQKSANPGNDYIKRAWPWSGRWSVVLMKHLDTPELQCIFYTGYRSDRTAEDYTWSLQAYKDTMQVFIYDLADRALSGTELTLYVDDVEILVMPAEPLPQLRGHAGVAGTVPQTRKNTVLDLVKAGGEFRLSTDTVSYRESLKGVKSAMDDFDECGGQADRLNALLKPPDQQ